MLSGSPWLDPTYVHCDLENTAGFDFGRFHLFSLSFVFLVLRKRRKFARRQRNRAC